MLAFPEIDPVAVQVGPLAIRWYGLSYLAGLLGAWGLLRYRASKPDSGFTGDDVSDLIFFAGLGLVVGGRVGYMLFYVFPDFVADPVSLFRIWEGGMSFHGGLLGYVVAVWWWARSTGRTLLAVTDFAAPAVPIGLLCGRIANFINGELWGRASDVPWAMIFPTDPLGLPRHPSQLYEAALEGVLLFALLWWFSARPRAKGAVSGAFLIGYAVFRSFVELFRQPDEQLGYLAFGWLTMGQLLCVPMLLFGVFLVLKR